MVWMTVYSDDTLLPTHLEDYCHGYVDGWIRWYSTGLLSFGLRMKERMMMVMMMTKCW